MRVGIIIGRIGGVDGVALETEKWITVLEEMGHDIYVATGNLKSDIKNVVVVPEMDFHHPLVIREQDDAFYKQKIKEETLIKRIDRLSSHIEKEIITWIVKNKIDVIISENASALPCHLSMGLAIKNVVDKTSIPIICHDHDYAWERKGRYDTKYKFVKNLIKECFPLKEKYVKRAVINTYAKNTIKKKFNLESIVVPNVMDFRKEYGNKDEFNKTLPKTLGLNGKDINLFQVTRIVRRKGIEVAINLISELDDPNIKLIITGGTNDDHNADYYGELVDLIDSLDLNERVIFAHNYFDNFRRIGKHLVDDLSLGQIKKSNFHSRVYSLTDCYAHAEAVTYFSSYEGFGNAFIEAVQSRTPVFVNNYEPVYWPDIGSLGFKTVMIEKNKLTSNAISDIKKVLYNKKLGTEMAEYNYKLGEKHFSYKVLKCCLEKLFMELQ